MRILSVIFTLFAIAYCSCPFQNSDSSAKKATTPRGHNKPFGYHKNHWRRVETIFEHPDPESFYNNYVRLSKPVIIRGGAADWPALHKWKNLSYISEMGGEERSHVLWKNIYNYDKFHPIRIDMNMREFTTKFTKHQLYLDATMQTGLHGDMYWPPSLACKFFAKRVKQLAIMMNSGTSKSPLHVDATDTYFIQVTGSRLWLLSPPSDAEHSSLGHPHLVDHSSISILNQTNMDLEKFPDASKLGIYAAQVDPGDIIYVPEGWLHQVKTTGSPNIGAPFFLNILFCEYSGFEGTDAGYVKNCVNKVRQNKPKSLKCDKFDTQKIPLDVLLKKMNPRNIDAFQGDFGESKTYKRYRHYRKILPDKTFLPTFGMTLSGMSQSALKKRSVLKHGVIEGYRLFVTSPGDGSEEALGSFLRSRQKFKKSIWIISYLPLTTVSNRDSVIDSIESSLRNLNIDRLDFVLLKAPYCTPNYEQGACLRNDLQQSWIDAWKAMEHLQTIGKIRFLGLSDFSLIEIKQIAKISKLPITIVRARFDLYFRNHQLRRYCKSNNIHFMGRSILGGRWKQERPDLQENRDIFQEHALKNMAYLHKLSIHSAVYDWATKKNVIVCPRVNDPLHVRVNIKAIDNESKFNVDAVFPVDNLDPTDKDGLTSPGAKASDFSRGQSDDDEEETKREDTSGESQEREHSAPRSELNKNFSEEAYTDEKDFEVFPTYMLGTADSQRND